jgi:hypothetical protein
VTRDTRPCLVRRVPPDRVSAALAQTLAAGYPQSRPVAQEHPAQQRQHVFLAGWAYSRFVNAVRELLRLTPVYQQVENGWTQASLVELPGVITAAPSREEAHEMLLDALREFLLSFGPGPMAAPMNGQPDALTLTISVGQAPAA